MKPLFLLMLALLAPFAAHATPSAPPTYPDTTHVFNGCRLSTERYLSRFHTAFPEQFNQPLELTMQNAEGSTFGHTVALVGWRGQLWCRDEYFGVFPLNCSSLVRPSHSQLVDSAQTLLYEQASRLIRTAGRPQMQRMPDRMSSGQRLSEAVAAMRIIPFPATLFWVHSSEGDTPMVLFRPADGMIDMYDPRHGTCQARCSSRNDAQVVEQMAARLGYRDARVG